LRISKLVVITHSRQVKYDEGLEFANKNGMLFYETSAKTDYNIDEVNFYIKIRFLLKVLRRYRKELIKIIMILLVMFLGLNWA
jgi:hypothetical protein